MPTSNPGTMEIAVIILVAVIVIAAIMMIVRRTTTRRLQDRFGSEYGRTVATVGDRGKAEADLLERQKRRSKLPIRPLDPTARERFREQWRALQMRFVDEPSEAVRDADALIAQVMRQRGYPMDEFDRRAADLSVDYPSVVNNYRKAHEIALASDKGAASTEDLRQATVYYRSLFDELLATEDPRLKETG